MGWGTHGYWHFGFVVVFLFLTLGFMILRMSMFRYCWGNRRFHDDDAQAIIRNRLARGEIGEEEYRELKEILNK